MRWYSLFASEKSDETNNIEKLEITYETEQEIFVTRTHIRCNNNATARYS